MTKITTSEIFYSPQGEGPYTGTPQCWLRVSKCNFQCRGFNNPNNVDPTTNEGLGFDPKRFTSLKDMPEITVGCDSIYSWDNRFKHLWTTWELEHLADALIKLTPFDNFNNIGLTLTGGEPTLRMKAIVELLQLPEFESLKTVTFETNCSVPLKQEHIDALSLWTEQKEGRKIVWSNSPKLRYTGEDWNVAINPDIANMQRMVSNHHQYFKFVVEPTEESFAEVDEAMEVYYSGGIPEDAELWVMPVGATEDQQKQVDRTVAEMALARGWNTSFRAHVYVFGAAPGT